MSKVWNQARELVDLGISIFPLGGWDGKQPLVSQWGPYRYEIADDEQLDYWEDRFSEDNYGIITGTLSGVIVVDVDSQEGVDYCKEHNIHSPVVVRTGKPIGYHLYFKHTGEFIDSKNKIVPGIDLKADNGYVVGPSSYHRELKKLYKWHRKEVDFDELPDFQPEWFNIKVKDDDQTIDLSSIKLAGMDLDQCSEGNRNNRLAKNVGYLANKGIDPNTIAMLLWADNVQNVDPPLGKAEFERTVKSICSKHKKENPQYLEDSNDNKWENLFNFDQWSCGYMAEEEPPEPEFLVRDLIVKEGCAGLLVAAGGTGKGYFSLDLAISLATGNDFFGREVCHTGETLIVNTEDSRGEQHRRMRRVMTKHIEEGQLEFEQIQSAFSKIYIPDMSEVESAHLVPVGDTPMERFLYAWVDFCRARGGNPQLVVIDPANKLILADMNDSVNASKLMAILNKFSKTTGVDSLLVTHTNKESQRNKATDPTAVLGSVSFANSARYVITMTAADTKELEECGIDKSCAPDYVCTTLAKCNYGAFDQFYLKRGEKGSDRGGVFSLQNLEKLEKQSDSKKIGFSQTDLIQELKEFEQNEHGLINRKNFLNFLHVRGIPREMTKTMLEGLELSGEIEIKKGKNKSIWIKLKSGVFSV